MTKLSYYMCTSQDDSTHLLYGTSKKEVTMVGEKLGFTPFKTIVEETFANVKANNTEEDLMNIRKDCKVKWDRKTKTLNKVAKVKSDDDEDEDEDEDKEE